jgi:long-chain fatty acid transport protein
MAESAMAGGFAIREQSAEGQGAAFAGVAAGTNGLSSMFWNPATMALHNDQGYISEWDAAVIAPYSRAKDGGHLPGVPSPPFNDSGNIGSLAFVPSSYWTYGINDRLTIGMSFNSPFGLVSDANDTWAGVAFGDKSEIKTYNANPQLAYRLNDTLSLGVGAQIEYMQADLTSRFPGGLPFNPSQPPPGTLLAEAKADGFAAGFTAGLLFQPSDATSIGLGYRSAIKHKLKGNSVLLTPIGNVPGTSSASIATPAMATFGVRHKTSDDLTLLAGVEWTDWSTLKALDITFTPPGVVSHTLENWKDGWMFSAGAEYAYSDVLLLRGGLAYEISPVTDGFRTPRAPDNDRVWLSAGATYKLSNNLTANLAYSHVFMKDGTVSLTSAPGLSANFQQHIDILSAGLTMDW